MAVNCEISGGKIKKIPKPHRRMFPGRKKRRVTLTMGFFWGLGHHCHATLREEDNPIFCTHRDEYTHEDHWHMAWDDDEGRGLTLSEKFNTEFQARRWVKKVWKENFSRKTHRLTEELNDRGIRWFYREGD